MHPNVVLLALLEVEDGAWSFMVAVSIVEEEEEVNLLRTKSTRSRGELDSAGGSFSLRPKKVVRTHGATRENKRYNCRPLSCSFSCFSNSNLAGVSKRKKGLGGSQMGPMVGSTSRPTKPDPILKTQSSVRAQFGESPREEASFGLPAFPVVNQAHETEGGKARSSKGGPTVPLSLNFQVLDSFAKDVPSIVYSQESSKKKRSLSHRKVQSKKLALVP